MEVFYIERGKYQGNIDIPNSLRTMDTGETWHINPSLVKMDTVRNVCSRLNSSTEMFFSASCPGFTEPCITVKRLK